MAICERLMIVPCIMAHASQLIIDSILAVRTILREEGNLIGRLESFGVQVARPTQKLRMGSSRWEEGRDQWIYTK